MNGRALRFFGALASGLIAATAHAAIYVSPNAQFSAYANINGTTTETAIGVSDSGSKAGSSPFSATKSADASGASGATSGEGGSEISGQFAWSRPDSDHFSLQVTAAGSVASMAACGANCTNLSASANIQTYSNFIFSIDAPYRYTMSFDLSDWSSNGSGTNYYASVSAVTQLYNSSGTFGASFNDYDYYYATGTSGLPNFSLTDILSPGTYTFYGSLSAAGSANASTATSVSSAADFAGKFNFALTPVPLPAAAWLLLSGLGGVAAFARRRRLAATAA